MIYNVYDSQNIKELINNNKRTNLDIQAQLFIKYLRITFDKYIELYSQIRSEFLNKNYSVYLIKTLCRKKELVNSEFLKCKCCGGNMVKRTSKGKSLLLLF